MYTKGRYRNEESAARWISFSRRVEERVDIAEVKRGQRAGRACVWDIGLRLSDLASGGRRCDERSHRV